MTDVRMMTPELFSHLPHCQREDEEKGGSYGPVLAPFYHAFVFRRLP